MAGRIRSIKPEILDDEKSAGLSDAAWRLWVSSWLLADDHGGGRAEARRLNAEVFWAAPGAPRDVEALLVELEVAGLIKRYTVRGQQYMLITNWKKHQRVDNAGKPRVPTLEEADPTPLSCARGDSPRTAESRGALPLDLRSPTYEQPNTHTPHARVMDVVPQEAELPPRPAAAPPQEFDGDAFQEAFRDATGMRAGLYDAQSLVTAAQLCRDAAGDAAQPAPAFAARALVAFMAWRETCTPPAVPAISPHAFVKHFAHVMSWMRDGDRRRKAGARGSPTGFRPPMRAAPQTLEQDL
jgi:hypothetical protein